MSVSVFMGYLKGKSSLMIFDRHANLKYRYDHRKFWCRGFYIRLGEIDEYIRNQLREDYIAEQFSLPLYVFEYI